MTLSERAAYLKGLCEGFDLDTTKPKNKLINDMITLLGEMACLLYTSPSPRDKRQSRMPSSA